MGTPATIEQTDVLLDDVAGHLNAQHGRLVDAAVWLLANEIEWAGEGVWKPEQYLAWRTGISPATARRVVAVARRVDELPDCVALLRRGELSLDQLGAIVRHAPGWADTRTAELAPMLTVSQLTRLVSSYDWTACEQLAELEGQPLVDQPAGDPPESAAAAEANVEPETAETTTATTDQSTAESTPEDRMWFGVGDDGRWRMFVDTTHDVGLILEAAIAESRDALGDQPDVTDLDALLRVAERSLDAVESTERRNRYRLNIHLDTTTGRYTDQLGNPVMNPTGALISCDCLFTPILFEDAKPVSVGRTQRIVPDRTRRTVLHRDGGCTVPGCSHDRHLEVHHIIHWTGDGPTDTWNLITLCSHHHRLHHRGRLGISGNADEPDSLVFTDHLGRVITPSGARPRPPTGPPPPIAGRYEHPLGERLDPHWVDLTPPRLRPTG